MSIDLYVHIVLFVENIQNSIGHFEQLFVFENSIYICNLLNYVSFIGALLVIFFCSILVFMRLCLTEREFRTSLRQSELYP